MLSLTTLLKKGFAESLTPELVFSKEGKESTARVILMVVF